MRVVRHVSCASELEPFGTNFGACRLVAIGALAGEFVTFVDYVTGLFSPRWGCAVRPMLANFIIGALFLGKLLSVRVAGIFAGLSVERG